VHIGGRLVAIEEKEGKAAIVWEYVTGSHSPAPPVLGADGNIRLHCADGMLHFIDRDGHQPFPPVNVGEPLGYAAPIVNHDGTTWISGFEGGLLQVNPSGTKEKRPFFRSRQRLDAPGVIHDGVIYIGSEDSYLLAIKIEERSGQNIWDQSEGKGATGWYIRSAPCVTSRGTVVVAGWDEHLYGFDPEGTELWKTHVPGQMLASPILDKHGHVYVGISEAQRNQEVRGSILCVDGNSHRVRWQYQAEGPVESTPVLGEDDILYFGDNAGFVHAVDLAGERKWAAQLGSAVRSAGTFLGGERVAFGTDDELLIALKCTSNGLGEGWPKLLKTLECSTS